MDAKVARRTGQEAGSVVLGRLAGRPCPPGFHNAEADTVVNEMDGSTPNHLEPDAVREQLKRILESDLFASAPRRCRFLTYIVEATITGNTKRLNQFAIGFKVFDRDKTFDPSTDAIVRVEAGRLRSRLIEYYILVHHFTTSLALILSIIFAVVVLMSFINFRYSRMIWMYMFTRKENLQG